MTIQCDLSEGCPCSSCLEHRYKEAYEDVRCDMEFEDLEDMFNMLNSQYGEYLYDPAI